MGERGDLKNLWEKFQIVFRKQEERKRKRRRNHKKNKKEKKEKR